MSKEAIIYVGDMQGDIMAGKGAGVMTVDISRSSGSYHTKEMLEETNPDYLISDLTGLLKILNIV